MLSELEKGKSSRKSLTQFNQSFSEMMYAFDTKRQQVTRGQNISEYKDLHADAEWLIGEYIKGKRWLDDRFDKSAEDLMRFQDTLGADIYAFYLEEAEIALDRFKTTGDKEFSRDAVESIEDALDYGEESFTIDSIYQYAFDNAIEFVLVESEAWDLGLKWGIDRRFEDIERRSRKFREIIYEKNTERVDCHILAQFGQVDVDVLDRVQTDNYSKDIVVRYETYKDTSGVEYQKPIYETITASVECSIRTKVYSWEMQCQIDRVLNYCNFRPNLFRTERVFEAKAFRSFGDERALPEEMKNLKDINFSIDEKDVLNEMVDDLIDQFENYYL